MKRIIVLLSLLLCTSILLAANKPDKKGGRRAPAAPVSDSRFFGTYYGSFSTTICKKYRVKFLWFKSGIKKKCEKIKVKDIRLHLDYQDLPVGGVISGVGEGTVKGTKIPISVAGKIVKTGKAWGMVSLMLPKFRTERGYTYLSTDGLQLSIPILKDKMILRKDAGANTPPQVNIVAPAASMRQSLEYGTTYAFSATVADAQQKTIPADRLIWKSDRDGVFKERGASVFHNSMSPGKHVITFEATDDGGLTGKASINIFVVNKAPDKPEIVQPLAMTRLYTSSPILFRGKAFDFEDGWLTGDALVWSSNKEGFLGKGSTMTAMLKMPGQHIIRLTATDKNGLSNFTEKSLSATKYTGNSPPQVTIDAPAHMQYAGIAVQSGKELTFRGTAKDMEDSFNDLKLEWRIYQVSSGRFGLATTIFGSGDKAAYKLMATGGPTIYVVTFAAKDSGGLEGQASMKIVVLPWTIK